MGRVKVAVFGSRPRYGPEIERVEAFIDALYERDPSYIIVSGGAQGVDEAAEQRALALGMQVISFRPRNIKHGWEDEWWIERWELGGASPNVRPLLDHPAFADFGSAATYRDMLIAEEADRGVAFHYGNSPGTAMTLSFFEQQGKQGHRFTKED